MNNCIITGGNSGIGYQAAMQIAKKGYTQRPCEEMLMIRPLPDLLSISRNNLENKNGAATFVANCFSIPSEVITGFLTDRSKSAALLINTSRELWVCRYFDAARFTALISERSAMM